MSEIERKGQKPREEDMAAENERLRHRVAELEAVVERLRAENEQLRAALEEARRSKMRQAAPFSKGPPKLHPKLPGRKPGHPPAHRPRPEQVDRVIDVPLPVEHCPACGGPLIDHQVQEQFQVDIPAVRPVTTQFNVHVARCKRCGKRVKGRHPEQTSDALGGAAVQLGPRALALAAEMKHRLGVSYGKLRTFFAAAWQLGISRATFARADQRLAQRLEPTYLALILAIRQREVVYADETGWKIGGHNAWVWVFTESEITVYVIDLSRGHEVVEEVVGQAFSGILVSDCFLAYDPLGYEQQKCLAHLLRSCRQIEALKSRGAVRFSRQVSRLLRAAIKLKERREQMSLHGYQIACGRLEVALDRLLEARLTDPDNVRLAQRLKKHRHQLFTFLYEEAVEATNNRAERALRPAVIVRKLQAGNRTERGAKTHAILASVIQTCRQRGQDFLAEAQRLLCSPQPLVLPLVKATARAP
jgi:transposase